MNEPNPADIAFKAWFNSNQPMMQIQEQAQKSIFDQAVFRAIRTQIEVAYKAGWQGCGEYHGPARDFDGNL